MKRWPKLSAVVDCASPFIVAAKVTQGPRRDTCAALLLARSAHRRTRFRRGLFAGGYDSEPFHALLRQELGAHRVIPVKSGGKRGKWPKTR